MERRHKAIIGLTLGSVALAAAICVRPAKAQPPPPPTYSYDVNVGWLDPNYKKWWQYIEEEYYKIKLKNGDVLRVNLYVEPSAISRIDVLEIRLYNISSPEGEGYGKLMCYLNGNPCFGPYPFYLGFPPYPQWGTSVPISIELEHGAQVGQPMTVDFHWEGKTLYVKSLELYLVGPA